MVKQKFWNDPAEYQNTVKGRTTNGYHDKFHDIQISIITCYAYEKNDIHFNFPLDDYMFCN